MNVIKWNFESKGISIADKRAQALHEWASERESVTLEEMKEEMARLKRIMPSPEDTQHVENSISFLSAIPE